MRRKNSLFISAVLAFSLCTATVIPVLAEDVTQAEAEAASSSDSTSADEQQGSADSSADEQQGSADSSADKQQDSAEAAATPYQQGTATDTDYQSEWLNLKFTPPDTVVMNTQKELESVMKQGQSALEDASGIELEEDALTGTVYEMMASSVSGFPNVSLVVEDAAMENMTVDQYFLSAQQMLDATQMGYTYEEITDAQIGGQDFRVMEAKVTVNDYEVIQKYCTRKQGGKFVSIILSYTADTTDEADEILAAFTPLNADTEAADAE